MKRTFYFLAILAAAALTLPSCNKPIERDTDGGETDDNTQGGTPPATELTDTKATGYFLGDTYDNGCDNYYLILTESTLTESGLQFSGTGRAFVFDLNGKNNGTIYPEPGTYTTYTDQESMEYTFIPGIDYGSFVAGSFIYEKAVEGGDASYSYIESGTVTIARQDDVWTITVAVVADGKEETFSHVGSLSITDFTAPSYTRLRTPELTKGEATRYGDAYGIPETDYCNWIVFLAEEGVNLTDLSGEGMIVQIELNTASSATDLTPGRYEVFSDLANKNFVAFTAVPGFINQYYWGTWVIARTTETYTAPLGADSGAVEVSKDGDIYTIDYALYDSDSMYAIIGSYTGPLDLYDETEYSTAAVKSSTAHGERCAFTANPQTGNKRVFKK